jgi:cytochrome P450
MPSSAPTRSDAAPLALRSVAGSLPEASPLDTLRTVRRVVLPFVARGPIVRRRRVERFAEKRDADRRAIGWMQRLHERYGPGPVVVSVASRRLALVLEPGDVHRVLRRTPVPFAADTRDKRAALRHFQPDGVLISPADRRGPRRALNDVALRPGRAARHEDHFIAAVVRREVAELLDVVDHGRFGELLYPDLARCWWRIVRQMVLGERARDDEALIEDLDRLRRRANRAILARPARDLRERFLRRISDYVDHPEPYSLVSRLAQGAGDGEDPAQQVPHWLFAFDAGLMTTMRSLALLVTHPQQRAAAEPDIRTYDDDQPYLRACALEALRLWPTTPAILRETTEMTPWETGVLGAGATVVIFTPFFHRDERRVPEAHHFVPELWTAPGGTRGWPFLPFSDGPAGCPGRDVVLRTVSQVVAGVLRGRDYKVLGARLHPDRPLPGTLSPFQLRLRTR